VFAEFRNPVGIVTKSALVARDKDILGELARHQAAAVFLSITTLDADLVRSMEPRAAAPHARLRAIRELTDAGVPCGVMFAPVIPGLNDHEAADVLRAAADHGARTAAFVILRLPFAVKDVFAGWLDQHLPERKAKILGRIRELRDGKLNDSTFGKRMSADGPWAGAFRELFRAAKQKARMIEPLPPLSTAAFRRPGGRQLNLFGEEDSPQRHKGHKEEED
jgi:DNA repair photolyase